MKKKTKWQLALIVSVLTLTLYNILPTLFFYTKPLHRDIGAKEAAYTAKEITNRVNALEGDAHAWLISFGKLIQTPLEVSTEAPHLLSVRFKTTQEADRFKRFFPKAGSLIPFFPSTLSLNDQISEDPLVLHIGRQIPIALSESLFHFAPMHQKYGLP